MKKKKVILTDIDGVVLDWEFAFHNWMEHRGHNLVSDYLNYYNMSERFNLKNAKRAIEQFNESASVGFIPPLRDAQYYIRMLHERHQYRFIAITSMSKDLHACKLRERNLSKLFGSNTFMEYHFLDCGADKDEVLADLSKKWKGHYWIEDKVENANVGFDLGFKALIMEHKHNMDSILNARLIPYVRNWEEIYNLVTSND